MGWHFWSCSAYFLKCNFNFEIRNLWQDTGTFACSAVANRDLQRPKPPVAPHQPDLWECESELKEWWRRYHPWHEAGKSRSHASTLSTGSGTVYKWLTYISRMLRLLSLSTEGINPHEGERHIKALVTGWHLAEDWTPRPCPPHYICHKAFPHSPWPPASSSRSHRDKCIDGVWWLVYILIKWECGRATVLYLFNGGERERVDTLSEG